MAVYVNYLLRMDRDDAIKIGDQIYSDTHVRMKRVLYAVFSDDKRAIAELAKLSGDKVPIFLFVTNDLSQPVFTEYEAIKDDKAGAYIVIMSLLTSREQAKLLQDSSFVECFCNEIKRYKNTHQALFYEPIVDLDFAYQCVKLEFNSCVDTFASPVMMRSSNSQIIKEMLARVVNNTFFDRQEI